MSARWDRRPIHRLEIHTISHRKYNHTNPRSVPSHFPPTSSCPSYHQCGTMRVSCPDFLLRALRILSLVGRVDQAHGGHVWRGGEAVPGLLSFSPARSFSSQTRPSDLNGIFMGPSLCRAGTDRSPQRPPGGCTWWIKLCLCLFS